MTDFTLRELEIWRLAAKDLPNKLIAYETDLKENTVKVHKRTLMRKLRITNCMELALAYYPIDYKNPPDRPYLEHSVKREVENADLQPSL